MINMNNRESSTFKRHEDIIIPRFHPLHHTGDRSCSHGIGTIRFMVLECLQNQNCHFVEKGTLKGMTTRMISSQTWLNIGSVCWAVADLVGKGLIYHSFSIHDNFSGKDLRYYSTTTKGMEATTWT